MITGFQVSGIARSIDNPLEFTVIAGKVSGPSSYRTIKPPPKDSGVLYRIELETHSTAEIVARLNGYLASEDVQGVLVLPEHL